MKQVACPIYSSLEDESMIASCDGLECPHREKHHRFYACPNDECSLNTDGNAERIKRSKSCACVEVE